MERKIIIKWLKIFSIGYIVIFAIELLNLIFISNIIILSIDSEQITISYLLFNSGYVDLQLAVLWIFNAIFYLCLQLSVFKKGTDLLGNIGFRNIKSK